MLGLFSCFVFLVKTVSRTILKVVTNVVGHRNEACGTYTSYYKEYLFFNISSHEEMQTSQNCLKNIIQSKKQRHKKPNLLTNTSVPQSFKSAYHSCTTFNFLKNVIIFTPLFFTLTSTKSSSNLPKLTFPIHRPQFSAPVSLPLTLKNLLTLKYTAITWFSSLPKLFP